MSGASTESFRDGSKPLTGCLIVVRKASLFWGRSIFVYPNGIDRIEPCYDVILKFCLGHQCSGIPSLESGGEKIKTYEPDACMPGVV